MLKHDHVCAREYLWHTEPAFTGCEEAGTSPQIGFWLIGFFLGLVNLNKRCHLEEWNWFSYNRKCAILCFSCAVWNCETCCQSCHHYTFQRQRTSHIATDCQLQILQQTIELSTLKIKFTTDTVYRVSHLFLLFVFLTLVWHVLAWVKVRNCAPEVSICLFHVRVDRTDVGF